MSGLLEEPLTPQAFAERLRTEGMQRYHHEHPFHRAMHDGCLTRHQLQCWVLNRYYYQTRIPIKDALILSKSDDPAFRRIWIHRIQDHDGTHEREGGLALWRRLAQAVGLDDDEVLSLRSVLPGVRRACDDYVSFVREAPLVEAVASSLTELFAPDLMARRLAAWERHYPWVDRAALEYFRSRIPRAARDADEALSFVLALATTPDAQARCVGALIRKTNILWQLLDHVSAASVPVLSKEAHYHDQPSDPGAPRASADRPTLA
jgi:coenzyme PQQ biosynthesis protein C